MDLMNKDLICMTMFGFHLTVDTPIIRNRFHFAFGLGPGHTGELLGARP